MQVTLMDKQPEIKIKNGLLYVWFDGQRAYAYPPHVARLTNQRIKAALDGMEAANVEKVVAFK